MLLHSSPLQTRTGRKLPSRRSGPGLEPSRVDRSGVLSLLLGFKRSCSEADVFGYGLGQSVAVLEPRRYALSFGVAMLLADSEGQRNLGSFCSGFHFSSRFEERGRLLVVAIAPDRKFQGEVGALSRRCDQVLLQACLGCFARLTLRLPFQGANPRSGQEPLRRRSPGETKGTTC